MKPDEYVTMRGVEDWHWWYAGLRELLKQHWNTCVSVENPLIGDIGCGTGANLALLKGSGRCFGFDRSFQAVGLCRERGLSKTYVGSIEAIPHASEAFDVVLSMDVLPHQQVRDKQDALNEMVRVLRPGGYMFLNLPAYQWLHSSHDVAVQQDWRPNRTIVRQMIAEAGLEVVRVTYWNTLLFPGAALVRLLRKNKRDAAATSDFRHDHKAFGDSLCGLALAAERILLCWCDLPVGLSVFAVARKPLAK